MTYSDAEPLHEIEHGRDSGLNPVGHQRRTARPSAKPNTTMGLDLWPLRREIGATSGQLMLQPTRERGDARRIRELSEGECLARAATEQVGRLAVLVADYPQVFCVNYCMEGSAVVFRTHLGTKLLAARRARVGFEVDHLDPVNRRGWSVLFQGMAEDVTEQATGAGQRSARLTLHSWIGDLPRVVRIAPVHITGRELLPR